MGRTDYGPWVKHDWCPDCARETEQTRWHLRSVPDDVAHRVRCNVCSAERSIAG